MIIERSETKEIQRVPKWIFIFGRRKTGKTFLVKNFIKYEDYFFVKTNRNIISEKYSKEVSYEAFLEILKEKIQQNKTLVIDEFHRLGKDFLDFLHYLDKKGKIILISSTLHLSKTLLESKSPILGLFAEFPLGIINLKDAITALKSQNLSKKELVEFAVLLREPITAEYLHAGEVRQVISEAVIQASKSIPAMIGEIFTEEERHISAVYEGILRAVANGNTVSTEISNSLFSKRLIEKDDPSIVQQYLKNLVEFGILNKIGVFNKNKFVYKHISP
ncbi:AAA family ATPase, partial [archaeon]|nr:AAA family ATPase [archaeon]